MINKSRPLLASLSLPFISLGIFSLVLIFYSPLQAKGGTYTVNTTDDTNDGTCNVAHCSLREAINAANAAAGADTITFTLPPSATITLNGTQLPLITDTLTIDGSTALSLTISGDNITRTFQIGSDTAVTLTTLTIADGSAVFGGAIVNNAGILNISDTTFKNNNSPVDSQGWYGGGAIFNRGDLNITNSVFSGNSAIGIGGAVYIYCCFASITISNSTFSDNSTGTGGGGIAIECCGIVNISNSTFINNYADAPGNNSGGGGILNSSVATVNINGSTFIGNSVNTDGGAISNGGTGTMNISNSTFSANSAAGNGGRIRNWPSGALYIYNSTFSENSASFGGGVFAILGHFIVGIANSIFANSTGGDCLIGVETMGFNINNLTEDGSCDSAFSGDPLLGPLQDNGGPTLTQALSSISPAIDDGDNITCAFAPVNNLDQRGVTRPLDGDGDGTAACDIGAYEYDGPPPMKFFLPVILRN